MLQARQRLLLDVAGLPRNCMCCVLSRSAAPGVIMEGGLRRPYQPLRVVGVLAAVLSTSLIFLQFTPLDERAGARPIPDKPNLGTLDERLNANTIAIVAGNPNATYLTIAYDMSDVLDDGDNFRILPVVGKGGGQNIHDVRFLKGIDLGISQSIILNEFRENGEVGNIDDKIDYITKLVNEEMHIVVRADSGISSIAKLNGKKVNFSDIGSGRQLSSCNIFRRLGIAPQEVNMGQGDALEKLKTGEIAAMILIAGKPTGAMGKLRAAEEPPATGRPAILADPPKTRPRTISFSRRSSIGERSSISNRRRLRVSLCDVGA